MNMDEYKMFSEMTENLRRERDAARNEREYLRQDRDTQKARADGLVNANNTLRIVRDNLKEALAQKTEELNKVARELHLRRMNDWSPSAGLPRFGCMPGKIIFPSTITERPQSEQEIIRWQQKYAAAEKNIAKLGIDVADAQEKITELTLARDHARLFAKAVTGDPYSIGAITTELTSARERVKQLEASGLVNGQNIALSKIENDKEVAYWRDKSVALRKERHELHEMIEVLQRKVHTEAATASRTIRELQAQKQPPTLNEARNHFIGDLERQLHAKTVELGQMWGMFRVLGGPTHRDAVKNLAAAHRQTSYASGNPLARAIDDLLNLFGE